MLNVANKKIIRKLSFRSFRSNRTRNIVALIAIALTTILFTSIFTVAISMNYSWQQQTMRMVGGSAHGGFKYLTKEQVNELKDHPLIKEYGYSVMLAMPMEPPFHKHHTEIRYGNDDGAKLFFSYPTTGRMPSEVKELATDTKVLDLLGVPHELGQKVTFTYPLGGKNITDTFTLCGFWETDETMLASQIWLSKDYVEEKLSIYDKEADKGWGSNIIGTWSLDVMFDNSSNIEKNLSIIAEDKGYNTLDNTAGNYLDTGVNWAYTTTHLNSADRMITLLALAMIVVLIVLTGYLIIYNIFQISISNDIRFYGLLKTIGTTYKQLKRLIRNQALMLSLLGIPVGLVIGFFIGNTLTKIIMSNMAVTSTYITFNPWIFIGSAVFSCITVLISTRKPGKMAASVSPMEAVRFVERSIVKQKTSRTKTGSKVYRMARGNLIRSRKKTTLVILSLSLSVVLLSAVYTFAKGFNMDKFLSKFVVSDFVVGHADYFKSYFRSEDQKVTESIISAIHEQEGITEEGRVYLYTDLASVLQTKKKFMEFYSDLPPEHLDSSIINKKDEDMVEMNLDVYGLDELPMKHLKLVKGSIDLEQMNQEHGIIQLLSEDDYGNPYMHESIYNIGDKVSIHYITDYDIDDKGNVTENNGFDIDYKVVATAMIPNNISMRRYGSLNFAITSDTMREDMEIISNNKNVFSTMNYMINVEPDKESNMESFIKDYTNNVEADMNYESKSTYTKEFQSFQNMFLLIGGILSLIIGFIGIMNFINAELTSIMSRKRELAMLNSIGMTGKQIKRMLVIEGLFYGGNAIVISFFVSILVGFFLIRQIESMLWFFQYHFTVIPILGVLPIFILLGIIIPLSAYKATNKQSIVERLREAE
ncbi:MAG: FtsX-like permease family protein [Anaerocolumna aminovalerica]|uniref:ABC transporter permease n=1 Tax=Anaerocolumna aminovalerica TaxID=1527 RepID=UPI000BE35A08|nr:ABC transporter permease [Anaerocolumna aminovalerica]MBU5333518.1 ABC transporter permease [Anaerocolumna aminovalerica]MDU6264977.1 FtsX-like permease family protein [Anaerocolumna aminovalerica]